MKFVLLFILLIPLVCLSQSSSHLGAPKYAPADGKKYLIMGQDLGAVGGLDSYADGYVDNLGHLPAGVTSYTSVVSGLTGLRNPANWGAGDVHAEAYIEDPDFDNSAIVIGLHMVGILNSIIAGSKDFTIISLGNWIKEQNRPVFLRIGYEVDGPWNGYEPEAFKLAWIHIVEIFDDLDVRNVAYVWQTAGINSNVVKWYPGDEYVNWIAYSQFDGNNQGVTTTTFAEERDKPVMIAEAAPRRDLKSGDPQTHWNEWFQPVFDKIYANDRIKAFAYINTDWESQPMWTGQGWGDSRVQANSFIQFNWETEIAKDTWILGDENTLEIMQYQLWQDSVITITGLEEERNNKEVVMETHNSYISIHSMNSQAFEGISIWDVHGRKVYHNKSVSQNYEVSRSLLPLNQLLIIGLYQDGELIIKKTINED